MLGTLDYSRNNYIVDYLKKILYIVGIVLSCRVMYRKKLFNKSDKSEIDIVIIHISSNEEK